MSDGSRTAYTDGHVISADGTRVGYRQIGSGPGIVLIQGAMGTWFNYDELARLLASDFTVYLPDRRGRGLSPRPYTPDHVIERDVEDIDALMQETAASQVFGLSSGAIIALEATRTLPVIERTVLYEPPFYLQGIAHRKIARFHDDVDRGDLASALVTAGEIVGLGPSLLRFVPRPLKKLVVGRFIRRDTEEVNAGGVYAPLTELIPAMRYDFNVVGGKDGHMPVYAHLEKPIRLLGGTKSPTYLLNALAALQTTLPNATREVLPGLDHSGAWNTDRGGRPAIVSAAMRRFFR